MIAGGGRWPPLVVALALQVGTNYANDYSDGVRGTDDGAGRAGAAGGLGAGVAGGGEAGRLRRLRRGRRWPAWPWPLADELVARRSSARRRIAAGWFYTGGPGPTATRLRRAVRVRVLRPGRHRRARPTCRSSGSPALSVAGRACRSGFLATALLVVNNLRDIPTDAVAGKRTLAVRIGEQRTRVLYVVLIVGALLLAAVHRRLGRRPRCCVASRDLLPSDPHTVLSGARGRQLVPRAGRPGTVAAGLRRAVAAGLFGSGSVHASLTRHADPVPPRRPRYRVRPGGVLHRRGVRHRHHARGGGGAIRGHRGARP